MATEIVWEGKFDANGRKKAPLRVQLPFQEVETINESALDRGKQLALFQAGQPRAWRNRLIWGDKKYVLPSLLPEFAGQVNLIYIDPPFAVGSDFSFQVAIENETFTKEPSMLEVKAYRDTWGKGLDSYLQWFYETVILLRELLAENGSIYVHLDYHVGHYAKCVLDEVFGAENFRNEIIVKRITKNLQRQFETVSSLPQGHDIIFWYSKYKNRKFRPILTENPNAGLRKDGYWKDFWSNADRPTMRYEILGVQPSSGQWKWAKQRASTALANYKTFLESGESSLVKFWEASQKEFEFIRKSNAGKIEHWIEPSETKFVDTLWTDISAYQSGQKDYATQKSEDLLERIIESASNEGDLVLDCFCGSGTTPAVAEKLGRRWIATDLGRFAIHTTRKRLLTIDSVRPFVVQNLGKYERQLWQKSIFGPEEQELQTRYLQFILKLYHAQPLTGNFWLHGIKAQRGVHIGSIDAPITEADVRMTVAEWQKTLGEKSTNGIDFLGWEFAFELNEITKQQAALAGADLRFLRIPREVLEQKAVEQGDIQFFELAALFVATTIKERTLTLKLTNFVLPLDYVPAEIQAQVTNWEAWIDYWAVDFAFKKDTFHNEWQSYRTRKANKIQTQVAYTYETPGTYQVQVKVIDLLGNDTTKTLQIVIAK